MTPQLYPLLRFTTLILNLSAKKSVGDQIPFFTIKTLTSCLEVLGDLQTGPLSRRNISASSVDPTLTIDQANATVDQTCTNSRKTFPKPFECFACSERFTRKADLSRHQRSKHSESKVLMCTQPGCKRSKGFARGDHLTQHMRKVHKTNTNS